MENKYDYEVGEDSLDASKMPKIRVVVRKRPRSGKEVNRNDQDIWECRDNETLVIKELKE